MISRGYPTPDLGVPLGGSQCCQTEADWAWADLVIICMIVRTRYAALDPRGEAARQKSGGRWPYVTSVPEAAQSAGLTLVLDEGEIPAALVEALDGETGYRAWGEKPDVSITTPIPRYDLLDLGAYLEMSVQFSRGCPFHASSATSSCSMGVSRTKTPAQMLAELQHSL